MKIAHIAPSFAPSTAYGGATDSVSRLCAALTTAGEEIRVLTTDADGAARLAEIPLDAETVWGKTRVRYCARQLRESISADLVRLLPHYIQWADVVHVTAVYSFPTPPAFAVARYFDKPVVWSPRGALERWAGSRKRLGKFLWDLGSRAIAPRRLALHLTSQDEAAKVGMPWRSVPAYVIPNGVEIPYLDRRRLASDHFRILFLGRLDPKKGIENLLDACAGLRLSRPWRLTITGRGEKAYERHLRGRVKELELTSSVLFTGALHGSEKDQIFEGTDLLVAPSHTENFCVVVAEALAHGVPVVASRGTPWREVETRDCGLWVNNDRASLRTAIETMSTRPLVEMGENGRRWMESGYSWSKAAESMVALYRQLVPGVPHP